MKQPSRYFEPDIDCTNAIAVILKTAGPTAIIASFGFIPMPALWTGLRGIPLILKLRFNTCEHGFVANHICKSCKRPLVNLLVRQFGKLCIITNAFEFAYHNRVRLCLFAVGYKT